MPLKLWLRRINIYSVTFSRAAKQTLNSILGRVLGRVTREGKAEPITFHTQITRLHAPEDRTTLALTHALQQGGPISCPHRQNSVSSSQSDAVFLPDADQGKSIRGSALNGHSLWLKLLRKARLRCHCNTSKLNWHIPHGFNQNAIISMKSVVLWI